MRWQLWDLGAGIANIPVVLNFIAFGSCSHGCASCSCKVWIVAAKLILRLLTFKALAELGDAPGWLRDEWDEHELEKCDVLEGPSHLVELLGYT